MQYNTDFFILYRYVGIDNTASKEEKNKRVVDLIMKITSVQSETTGVPYYVNEMYEEARKVQEKIEEDVRRKAKDERLAMESRIKKEMETQKARCFESMKTEFEKKKQQMELHWVKSQLELSQREVRDLKEQLRQAKMELALVRGSRLLRASSRVSSRSFWDLTLYCEFSDET